MSPSKILLCFCASAIIGVFVCSVFPIFRQFFLYEVLAGILISVFYFIRKDRRVLIFGLCILCFSLGVFRCQSSASFKGDLQTYNQNKVVLVGKIISEPDVRANSTQIILATEKILVNERIFPTSGKVLVTVNKYDSYNYADILEVKGLLKTPEKFEDFDYPGFLARKGIFSMMSWPETKVLSKENYANVFQLTYGKILVLKNIIRQGIDKSFPFLEGKLLAGILLGDKSNFSEDFRDKLNATGLSHITAVSGMNVAILCSVLMSLFLGFGLWRSQAFYLTLIFILLFVLLIGPQASVVRAGIMGAVLLLAQKVGRLPSSLRIIVFTATAMVLINPTILVWDVGFQLSFLAILGIVLLTEPFNNTLRFIPEEKFINLRSIVSATLSAQIFTLPILIYNFGRVSLVSPITNILVVPIIDLVMILGIIFAILNSVWWVLGWLASWPCWLLLAYILKVVSIFSKPWAVKSFEDVHWTWLLFLYLVLAIVVMWIKQRARLKFLDF